MEFDRWILDWWYFSKKFEKSFDPFFTYSGAFGGNYPTVHRRNIFIIKSFLAILPVHNKIFISDHFDQCACLYNFYTQWSKLIHLIFIYVVKKFIFFIWFDAQYSKFERAHSYIILIYPRIGSSKNILTLIVLCIILLLSGKNAQILKKTYQPPVTHANWFQSKPYP